jgi:hypothetical protein
MNQHFRSMQHIPKGNSRMTQNLGVESRVNYPKLSVTIRETYRYLEAIYVS